MKFTRSELKNDPSTVFDKALIETVEITFRGKVKHILISPDHPAWVAWIEREKEALNDTGNTEESN